MSLRLCAAALALAGLTFGLWACDADSHAYVGRVFDPARQCLGPTVAIDVVSGDDPGSNCARKCLLGPPDGGARPAYVSSMCPPYPRSYTTENLLEICPQVIAAAERIDECLPDGGSTNPVGDAGPE